MPLTPEDVRNKQFTTVRLREGYDEDEVDAFLDEVEAELTRLLRENDELRAKLAAATRAAASAPAGPVGRKERPEPPAPIPAATPVPVPAAQSMGGPMGGPMGGQQMGGPPQMGGQMGAPGGGGDSAARVLALAQQTADQAIAEARSEANKIIGEARTKAEALERDARAKADAMERDAQQKHQAAIGSLENQRVQLERKVDELRGFEREYRSRLRSYLEGQMRQLEGQGEESLAPPARAPLPQPAVQQMRPAPQPQSLQAPTPMRGFLIDEDPDH
jgi:DivIVA domain-containing protein